MRAAALPGVSNDKNEATTLEEIVVTAQKRSENLQSVAAPPLPVVGEHWNRRSVAYQATFCE